MLTGIFQFKSLDLQQFLNKVFSAIFFIVFRFVSFFTLVCNRIMTVNINYIFVVYFSNIYYIFFFKLYRNLKALKMLLVIFFKLVQTFHTHSSFHFYIRSALKNNEFHLKKRITQYQLDIFNKLLFFIIVAKSLIIQLFKKGKKLRFIPSLSDLKAFFDLKCYMNFIR